MASTDQLNITLTITDDGKLQPIDNTDYAQLSCESDSLVICHHHSVVEYVTGPDGFTFSRWRHWDPSKYDGLIDFYKDEDSIELEGDGVYYYYKAILPCNYNSAPWSPYPYSHPGNDKFYCIYGQDKILSVETGKEVAFGDFWDDRDNSNNVFSNSEQTFVTIYDLIKCFVLTERDRLNEAFKNGCDLSCKESPLGLKANLLAVIVFLLWHYVKDGKWDKAKALYERIQVCNGLCNTVKKQLKSCGCYEGDI